MKFGEAVDKGFLSDYHVVVIGYDQSQVVSAHNSYLTGEGETISTEEWIQMIGCWDALADPETNGPDRNRQFRRGENMPARHSFFKHYKIVEECCRTLVPDRGYHNGNSA